MGLFCRKDYENSLFLRKNLKNQQKNGKV